jgi:YVTN family beta-propeller protein
MCEGDRNLKPVMSKRLSTFVIVAVLTIFTPTYVHADSVEGTISVGTRPVQIAITSDNATAYVTNYDSGNISVIDLATNQVTNTISVGVRPVGIALSPDNSKAYVALSGAAQVVVINLSNATITHTISVGISPYEIALTADGTFAYVTNFTSNTVSKINLATNIVTTTISVDRGPRGIAINPAGTKAYTANGGAGGVSEINLANNSVTNIVTTDSDIIDIVIDSDGNKAYASGYDLGNVEVIDLATSTVTNRIPLSAGASALWGITIEPTGKYVYVYARSGSIEKIDTDTNSVVQSIAVTAQARHLTINNAGTYAYLANFDGADTVTILKLDPINENSEPWVGAQSITCPAPNPWVNEELGFATNAKPVLVSAENTVGKTITQGSYDSLKSSGVVFDTVSKKVSTATETLPIYGCKDKLLSGKVNQPIQFIAGGYTLQSDAHGYMNTADLKWHDTNSVTLYTNTAAFMHTIKFTKTGKYVVVLTEQPDTSRGLIPTYGVRSIRFVININ